MNRRPSQSKSEYDAFSASRAAQHRPHTSDADFFISRKRMPHWQRGLILLLAALLLFAAANFVCNQFVFVRRVSVPVRGLSEAFEGYTILHLSDLKGKRFGAKQGLFEFCIGDAQYDLVLMTGDMISPMGNAQPFYELLDRLGEMDSDAPVYYIAGDSDPLPLSMQYAAGGSPFAPWVLGAKQRGAQMLSSPVFVERDGQRIWLTTRAQTSLDLDAMQGQYEEQYLAALDSGDENAIEMASFQLSNLKSMRKARKEMSAQDVYIALTHTLPNAEDTGALMPPLIPRAVDLMLGGHYLGGLVRLPVLGPLFVPSSALSNYGILPGRDSCSGLTRAGSTWMYASTGLGSQDAMYPKWFLRILNPPSVTLITLTPSSL